MAYRFGHCKEARKVTRKAQSWFDSIQLAHLARIEAQQAQPTSAQVPTLTPKAAEETRHGAYPH
jgi:hypothetical protein